MKAFLNAYFGLIRKFLPKEKHGTSVGIDIGISECKLVEVKKTGDGYELVNWRIEPIQDGNVKASIEKILSGLSEPPENVYTAISGKGTLIRYIEMPKMSLDDLKGAFSIEADKYFPFPQDQIYTDCYILDAQGKDKKMPVMAAAAKKELIDDRVKLLTDLELKIGFIGLNPVALTNVVNVLGFGDVENSGVAPAAILDMGEFVSSLTIINNKVPRFSRDIYIGGRDLTKRISNALGVDFKEAERLKRDPGEKLDEVTSACDAVLANIVQEMALSLDYFTTEGNDEVATVYLTGGASMFKGVRKGLEANLNIKVQRWDPLKPVHIPENQQSEELQKNSFKLGVALGLSLYQDD
ncbi:MAG: type IV pilus assembly protein PilM [Candidatus Omnitrophica bacterium]|nr:type IV pilus assembly protein PilM [Candidatus Omnitrophota bacterium]